MGLSPRAQDLVSRLAEDTPKLGDLRKMAKEIKRDHDLALELWSTGAYYPRLLALLIMDKRLLTQDVIESLAGDIQEHNLKQRSHLADWLLANQLTKSKQTIALMETWEDAASPTLRRIFWYHQGRLRWRSKAPPDNAGDLLTSLERDMGDAEPEVQMMMNLCAAQIGIYEPEHRARCVALGERLRLYVDEKVPRGCTPPYLPVWISTEVAKLG